MADLKTTTEERTTWRRGFGGDLYLTKALDDLDTLLAENAALQQRVWDDARGERAEWCGRVLGLQAENAKLRAAIASARDLIAAPHHTIAEELAHTALDAALAALEAP